MDKRIYNSVLVTVLFRWLLTILSLFAVEVWSQEVHNTAEVPPQVQTQDGKVEGTFYYTEKKRKIYAFLGLPYARPPLRSLRFKEPQPIPPWEETRYAITHGPECLWLSEINVGTQQNKIVGTEDCLYMDIYTPTLYKEDVIYPKSLFPVVVNFHGGPVMAGKYEPRYLLDNLDAVFVNVNYRQGVFGFLSTESKVVPGNMGLKDQVLALKWIQENIMYFSGDAKKVTLVGMSMGGASVHYHYLSQQSRHLFKQGISVSGTALCPWALTLKGKEKTYQLAASLGCLTDSDFEVVDCLKSVSGPEILQNVERIFKPFVGMPILPFGPVVEKGTDEPFLDDNPYNIIRKGRAKDAPWLISVVKDEGIYPASHFVYNKDDMKHLEKHWIELSPYVLNFNDTLYPEYRFIIETFVRDNYIKSLTPQTITTDEVQKQMVDLLSDRLYKAYIAITASMHAVYYKKSNIYLYNFCYRGTRSVSSLFTGTEKDVGVCHGDDTIYTFGNYFWGFDNTTEDYEMVIRMQQVWASFIINGSPTIDNITWPAIDKDNILSFRLLNIFSPRNFTVEETNDFSHVPFWVTLYMQLVLGELFFEGIRLGFL